MNNHDDLGFVPAATSPELHDDLGFVPHEQPDQSSISLLESLLRGGANQFNMAPVVSGAAQHPAGALKELLQQTDEDTNAYDAARDKSNQEFKAAEAAHPVAYNGANIAGGVALSTLLPEIAAAKGLSGALKIGGAYGALNGIGSGLSEGKSAGGVLGDAALQGTLGAATGGLVHGVVGGLAKLTSDGLKKSANQHVLESFNPPKSEITKLRNAPLIGTAAEGETRLDQAAQRLLEPSEWMNNEPIFQMGSAENNLNRLQTAQHNSGSFLGTVANKVDEHVGPSVDTAPLIDEVEKIINDYRSPMGGDLAKPIFVDQYNELQRIKQYILEYGNNPISFKNAEQIKRDLSELAYGPDGKMKDLKIAKLRGFFNDHMEDALDKATQSMGDPALYNKYLKAKDLYGATKQLMKSADNNVSKEISNRDFGITDLMVAGMGASAHGGPGAVAALGLKKAADSYGHQGMATAQQWGANTMKQVSSKVSAYAPEQLKDIGTKLSFSGNPVAAKLGNVLSDLSAKDGVGRNAIIFSLLQNPAYREILRDLP